jgi:integral membrane protein
VRTALLRYQILAATVGVLLVVLFFVGVPLANFTGGPMWHVFDSTPEIWIEGSRPQLVGEFITGWLATLHGWLYMLFVIFAFLLSRKAGWDLRFTVVTLLLGTVPVLSFWAERRATRRVRHEHPELVSTG